MTIQEIEQYIQRSSKTKNYSEQNVIAAQELDQIINDYVRNLVNQPVIEVRDI